VVNVGKQINALKENPKLIEQLIYKGKHISDYNVDNLKIDVLPSGFPSFDKMAVFKRGRGELIYVGARPSIGKSSLILQISSNMAKRGRVMYFSLEDNHEAIVTRLSAAFLNKSIDVIHHGAIARTDLIQAQEYLSQLNLIIDDAGGSGDEGGLNAFMICERARMRHSQEPLVAVFVDYIQIVKNPKQMGRSRADDVAEISAQFKALAKELGVPVIVASQLNRNSELRETKKPQLSDFKESGAIEQDADVALLIHREGVESEIIVAKNKNGPTGSVLMQYHGPQCKFVDKQSRGGAHDLD
jgi:replicative DNA helicase